jgi:hypothetical protein
MVGTKDKAGIFRSTTLAGSAPLPPSWLDSRPHLLSRPNPAEDLNRDSEITKRRRGGDSELARKKARHSFTTFPASLPPNNSVEIPMRSLSDAFPSRSISTTSNHVVTDSHSNTLGCVKTNAEAGRTLEVNLMCTMAGRAEGAPCFNQQPALLRSSQNEITFQPTDDVQALQQQLASAQAELREFRTMGDNICQSCKEKFSPSTEPAPLSVLVNPRPSPSKPTDHKPLSRRVLRKRFPLPVTSNSFTTVSARWSVQYKTTERRAIDVNFVRAFAQEAYVACVKFSQDGKYLAAAIGYLTGKAVIWEVESSKEIRSVLSLGFHWTC